MGSQVPLDKSVHVCFTASLNSLNVLNIHNGESLRSLSRRSHIF